MTFFSEECMEYIYRPLFVSEYEIRAKITNQKYKLNQLKRIPRTNS